MGIRQKLFLILFLCGIAPMLLIGLFNYWSGAQSIEALLRSDIEQDLNGIERDVKTALREREEESAELARSSFISSFVGGALDSQTAMSLGNPPSGPALQPAGLRAKTPADSSLPESLRAQVSEFLISHRKYYSAVTCFDASRRTLFRAEISLNAGTGATVHFQTENFLPGSASPDERVWTTAEQKPISTLVIEKLSGAIVRYTIPVFYTEASATAPRGALLVDLKLDALYREAASGRASLRSPLSQQGESSISPRIVLLLDQDGQIIYHINEALKHQPVSVVLSHFQPVAEEMRRGAVGWRFYDSPEGERWLAGYRPAMQQGISLAVVGDYTAAMRGLRRRGWIALALTLLIGIVAVVLLAHTAGRTARSIEQVTEGAAAIAEGKLDQRIEVRSSDEMRLLADSVNQMKEQLHEQMRRESEMQQFQSFMRISAMLTHDLKNAIAGLSLLVDNMESKFDREEFRRDAMRSLKEAANKLRRLVAKLSNPVETLSGEYKLPRPTDLVPIIQHALATTAEPVSAFHEIETHLPPTLIASVDGDRIEKIIENLALNALEAMGAKRGKLTVEAGPAGEGELFFSVSDTGPGMSEEFISKRLFRPFSTTKSQGVGLGLYTCREVVRAYGGRIEVESQKGVGTRFRVVLPLVQKIIGPGETGQSRVPGSGSSKATG
ncbi:MAG TPA: ATP-binding protein [Pyrinomonadaceae bacterium]